MKLVIDYRETLLYNHCRKYVEEIPQFSMVVIEQPCSLSVGDAILRNNDGQDCIIIERKTINDLVASLRDGRYEEQSYRLNGVETHNHNIIFLIEGDIANYQEKIHTKGS